MYSDEQMTLREPSDDFVMMQLSLLYRVGHAYLWHIYRVLPTSRYAIS